MDSFLLPPRVQSQPIKKPKQCGLLLASLTSLPCKTFPAKEAPLFAGKKVVCNFPDLAFALQGKEKRELICQKQTGPKTANKFHTLGSGPCCPQHGVLDTENGVLWGRETRGAVERRGSEVSGLARILRLWGRRRETDIKILPTLRLYVFSRSHETRRHLPHH